jgi:hypothetical protein
MGDEAYHNRGGIHKGQFNLGRLCLRDGSAAAGWNAVPSVRRSGHSRRPVPTPSSRIPILHQNPNALESMRDHHDIFGSPPLTITPTKHHAANQSSLTVLHNGRWVPVEAEPLGC